MMTYLVSRAHILLLATMIVGQTVLASESAPLWTPEQALQVLRPKSGNTVLTSTTTLAEGQLYLLPESTFPFFESALANRADQVPGPFENAVARALVLRGYPPAVKACAHAIMSGGGPTYAYFLREAQLLPFATGDELLPLARELVPLVEGQPKTMTWQGNEMWITIAGRTGELHLLQLAVNVAMNPQFHFARGNMTGRFDPDRCGVLLAPFFIQGPPETKVTLLKLLGRGWHQGPAKSVSVVMSDPDPLVRNAFAITLGDSISDRALEVIIQGLNDVDISVRSTCMAALATFHGKPQTDLLQKLALDPHNDANMRAQAWNIISNLPGDALAADAKVLVTTPGTDRTLRDLALHYLLMHQGTRWLFDALPRLDTAMKSQVLTALARSGSVEVLAELPAFLRQAEGLLAAQVLQSLISIKDPQVLPLLISHLEDMRPEVRAAAASTLSGVTGLSYHPLTIGRTEVPGQFPGPDYKALHAGWQQWYDLFKSPLDDASAADLTTARATLGRHVVGEPMPPIDGLIGDPYSVLLRLSGENNMWGTQALSALVAGGDARLAKALIGLIDGPTFSQRTDELTLSLMRCRMDQSLVPLLEKMLDRPGPPQQIAIQVLVSWRISSPALITAIFQGTVWPARLVSELASWKECPVTSAARKYLTSDKTDEHLRTQSLDLLVQIGDERDIKALSQEVTDVGSVARNAVHGLVNMAVGGLDSATQALTAILTTSARKAAPPMPAPKPGEERIVKQDPAPMIISALLERLRDSTRTAGSSPVIESEPLKVAVRAWIKATKDEQQRLDGLALLLNTVDPTVGDVLHAFLTGADVALQKRLFALVLASSQPELRPCVDQFLSLGLMDPSLSFRMLGWYRTVAKLPPAEIAKMEAAIQASQDSQAGHPVRGLIVSIEFPGTSAPLGAKGLKAKVQIKNVGKKPYKCWPEMLQFFLNIHRLGENEVTIQEALHLDFKSKPQPPPGGGTQLTSIEPGQTFVATGLFDAPPTGFTASIERVHLSWQVPDTMGGGDPQGGGTFTTPWVDFSFIPPLWEAVDRRTNPGVP